MDGFLDGMIVKRLRHCAKTPKRSARGEDVEVKTSLRANKKTSSLRAISNMSSPKALIGDPLKCFNDIIEPDTFGNVPK